MANVSQLQPALTPQVQTNSAEAQEKDANVCLQSRQPHMPFSDFGLFSFLRYAF